MLKDSRMDVVVSANRLTAYSFFLSVSLSAFTQWGNQNNYSSSKIRWVIDTDIEFNFFLLGAIRLEVEMLHWTKKFEQNLYYYYSFKSQH